VTSSGPFDPIELLRRLVDGGVRFVVIGGIAAQYRGAPVFTFDLDICHARDRSNLEALATVLGSMNARLRGAPADLPFVCDWRTLHNGDSFTFVTDLGDFDILGTPVGSGGFAALAPAAVPYDLGDFEVLVASIDDLMAMKRAAGRAKDLAALEILGALREEVDRRPVD